MERFASVAIRINLNRTFSYIIPDELLTQVQVGKRVLVPFQKRQLTGYVVKVEKRCDYDKLKEIVKVLDEVSLFSADDLELFKWLSSYYMAPLAEVIKTALPSGIDIESKKYYEITSTGEGSIEKGGARNSELLLFIKDNGPVASSKIVRRFPAENVPSILSRLANKGFVSFKEEISEQAVKKSYVKHIVLNEEKRSFFIDHIATLRKNAVNFSGVCHHLLDKGEALYPELNKKFKNVKNIIDKLAELEFIEVRQKEKEAVFENPFEACEKEITLTKDQKSAVKQITLALEKDEHSPFLLHGCTGSGKTEVYSHAAKKAVELGKSVIILVPEIALTPHFIKRFTRHFDRIAVVHSSISPRERYQYYLKALDGDVKVVIGVRSAIFMPLKDLGLIVVDEEHVSTYKQDDGFKYNARDVALLKAKMKQCSVVLGSATPSLESYYNAKAGKYKYLMLKNRVNDVSMPKINIVDMKDEMIEGDKKSRIISKTLKKMIQENLKAKKQTILFLNRRGHSSFVICYDCSEPSSCPNCSVSLTYHRTDNTLVCHYCGFKKALDGICPTCGSSRVRPVGFGTQRVNEIIKGHFKEARIFRMDSDTMTKKDSFIDFYKRMDSGDIDIVIGTQMIAKGHDFENVTLVGILNADAALMLPDFRSEEKCFSIITQVSGRAGRGKSPGRVVIQTLNPDNDYIDYALKGEVEKFYEKELELRKALKYPPFTRMANIKIIARREKSGIDAYNNLEYIKQKLIRSKKYKGVSVLGPVTCPLYKIKNKFRWQMIARSKESKQLHLFVRDVERRLSEKISLSHVKISIDVDPINML